MGNDTKNAGKMEEVGGEGHGNRANWVVCFVFWNGIINTLKHDAITIKKSVDAVDYTENVISAKRDHDSANVVYTSPEMVRINK